MATPLLEPIASLEWTPAMARHLLNRAGFGIDAERLGRLSNLLPDKAVDDLVDFARYEESVPPPSFLVEPKTRAQVIKLSGATTEDEKRKAYNEYQGEERQAVQALKAWWLARMFATQRPLQEKLALFWHGHFATSAQKVKSSWHTFDLNQTFREHAAGNFKALTIAVGQSPSMLVYLDNRKSTKQKPNENWARELMELFTMGIGTYSESDIKNSARAFTGWTSNQYEFSYNEKQHDFGEKVFLGKAGAHDGWDVIDIIFEQPATAEFICGKLWAYFAYENPEPEIVQAMAATFRKSNYELAPVLKQMFLSRAFYSDRAVGRQVKSPAQVLVQTCHDLGMANPPYGVMARLGRELGQDLFFPPNVKGWDGNRAWINANSLLVRYNLPVQLAGAAKAKKNAMMAETTMTEMSDSTMQAAADSAPAVWNVKSAVDGLTFQTAGECIDGLAARFLSVPLSAEQRGILVSALGATSETDAITVDTIQPRPLQNALRLLLSCAEYQVC